MDENKSSEQNQDGLPALPAGLSYGWGPLDPEDAALSPFELWLKHDCCDLGEIAWEGLLYGRI